MVGEDDIVFSDFGPVFEEWRADFGRTYVLGNDPLKLRIREETEEAWYPDKNGRPRDWILEIHFVDEVRECGGFFEQLLTVE